MKIAVKCQSPLLQKALELFLAKYLVPVKKSDIIVQDSLCIEDKRCFYIAQDEKADLRKPFAKSQLVLALEKRYKKLQESSIEIDSVAKKDFALLEKKIEQLTQDYQKSLLQTVKAFYENK